MNAKAQALPSQLILYIDGASRGNPGPSSAGVEIQDEAGKTIRTLSEYLGTATNNVAEYMALIYGLEEAAIGGASRIRIHSDSELLCRQFSGKYKVKDAVIKILHRQVKRLAGRFEQCEILHIPREQNQAADRLANQALDALL